MKADFNYVKHLVNTGDRVRTRIYKQVGYEVWVEGEDRVSSGVWSQIWFRVGSQVEHQVWFSLGVRRDKVLY